MTLIQVQDRQCATCIYRRDTSFNLPALEKEIADPRMAGHFRTYRQCHHSGSACCRGFWNRHRDHFDLGHLAQRLNGVEFVRHDQ